MPRAPDDEGSTDDEAPDPEGPPDAKVLAPDELDITREEEVAQLEDGRFVIGTEGEPNVSSEKPNRPRERTVERAEDETASDESAASADESKSRSAGDPSPEPETADRGRSETRSRPLSGSEVKRWLSRELARTDSQYAYRIAAKTGENISHQQLASDDVNMAFDGLLMWYAQQVGRDTAVEEALGILLSRSNIRVRFPVAGFIAYLERHDLEPDDDISKLLETIRNEDGFVFPPGHHR